MEDKNKEVNVKVKKSEIHIIKDHCKGCRFCIEFCPRQVLDTSSEFNEKGYHPPYVKNEFNCINCKLCQLLCPEFAIYPTKIDNPTKDC